MFDVCMYCMHSYIDFDQTEPGGLEIPTGHRGHILNCNLCPLSAPRITPVLSGGAVPG